MYSQMIPLGTPCPSFTLPGIDGKTHSLDSFADEAVLVVICMCNHCPYVQAEWAGFVTLQRDFEDRGVRFIGINGNDAGNFTEDSFEKMKEYAEKYRMNFPYLFDETQRTVRAFGAVCTPDIFAYGQDRTLAYRGRLDDLRDALDALLREEAPNPDQKPSQGCSVKWK